MKELSVEEKAKLYDKAIAHARSLLKTIGNATLGNLVLKNEFKNMFPVLEENEDERIRKEILTAFSCGHDNSDIYGHGITYGQVRAWLEKQREQKPTEWHREDEQNLNACLGYIPDEFLRRWLTDIIHVKYDKVADKVESKFNKGDILYEQKTMSILLVYERNGSWLMTFCDYWMLKEKFHVEFPYENYGFVQEMSLVPATKEQRDLLFQKIKENGYEWDAEKKELKKPAEEYNITGIGSKNAQGKLGEMIKNLKPVNEVLEQKLGGKVEPKFKVGDWIIKNDDSLINIDYSCCKITKVENGNYTIESIGGYKGYNTFDTFDKDYHLWTIQDAKEGDVLYDGNAACIFRKTMEDDDAIWIDTYCGININNEFKVNDEDECWCLSSDCSLATKEQRELLFQKIKEAGYEWDAENKELKKVEQKLADYIPKFHVGDKLVSTKNPSLTYEVLEVGHISELGNQEYKVEIFTEGKVSNPRNIHYMECYKVDEWAKQIEQKLVEWGEEDANHVKSILSTIECCKAQFPNAQAVVEAYNADIDWLKSLKDRVQLQDRINIEVWVTKNKQWILKLNGKVVRGQWGDEPQCIYKQFFYLSEIESLKE